MAITPSVLGLSSCAECWRWQRYSQRSVKPHITSVVLSLLADHVVPDVKPRDVGTVLDVIDQPSQTTSDETQWFSLFSVDDEIFPV